jgi:hypothetical protein
MPLENIKRVLEHGLPGQFQKLLWRLGAEAAAGTRGENDGDSGRHVMTLMDVNARAVSA